MDNYQVNLEMKGSKSDVLTLVNHISGSSIQLEVKLDAESSDSTPDDIRCIRYATCTDDLEVGDVVEFIQSPKYRNQYKVLEVHSDRLLIRGKGEEFPTFLVVPSQSLIRVLGRYNDLSSTSKIQWM